MIGSTLIEQTQPRCFYFHPSKQDCFGLKGPCQHQGNLNKQTSAFFMVARCQRVVGKHLSIQNNRVSIDENRKSGFIQANRPFDLSGPIKLAKFTVFIYSKMEHKINKIRRNVYTSEKPSI